MNYPFLIATFLIIILASVIVKYFKKAKKKKAEDVLRASYGLPKEDFYSAEWIQKYFVYKQKVDSETIVNDQMCNDLDFQELFQFADRTTSIVGQQYLY